MASALQPFGTGEIRSQLLLKILRTQLHYHGVQQTSNVFGLIIIGWGQ